MVSRDRLLTGIAGLSQHESFIFRKPNHYNPFGYFDPSISPTLKDASASGPRSSQQMKTWSRAMDMFMWITVKVSGLRGFSRRPLDWRVGKRFLAAQEAPFG